MLGRCPDDGGPSVGPEEGEGRTKSAREKSGGGAAERVKASDADRGEADSSSSDTPSVGRQFGLTLGDKPQKPDNPYGLSLGADKAVEKIEKMKREVERYRPDREYQSRVKEKSAPAPIEMPSHTFKIPIEPGVTGHVTVGPGKLKAGIEVGVDQDVSPFGVKMKLNIVDGVEVDVLDRDKSAAWGKLGFEIGNYKSPQLEVRIEYGEAKKGVIDYLDMSYRESLRGLGVPRY